MSVSGKPASVAGAMESPFSPVLPHGPGEDWGEWICDCTRARSGASAGVFPLDFRPVAVTGVDEPCRGSEATGCGSWKRLAEPLGFCPGRGDSKMMF